MTLIDPVNFPNLKFGVGQSVVRKEDNRLLRGQGKYADDVSLPNQAYGAIVRSTVAHGRLIRVDGDQAVPGVLAIYTAADMAAAGYGPMPFKMPLVDRNGTTVKPPRRPALAEDKVRYVGEAIALVVAETAAAAIDGRDAVEVEIEELPAVTELQAATEPGAPQLYPEFERNICFDWTYGDADACDRAFAEAAHVTRLRLHNNRVVVAAMEPRAAVAEFDAQTSRFTLHLGCQGVFGLSRVLADDILNVPEGAVRVRTYDVGGSFGMKASPYPEYVALLHAARELGRPVKWCDQRTESFLSDQHGRDAVVDAALALDDAGNFLAVRVDGHGGLGGYLANFGPFIPTVSIQKNLPGVYKTPIAVINTKCVFTNSTPVGPYRGAGRPEANYYMERLVDKAARELGRDPIELRRQNMVDASDIPFKAASGLDYDSGDFKALLSACVDSENWAGYAQRRRQSESQGRLRGRGFASYLEVTAPAGKEMGGLTFTADGRVVITSGTLNYGQGHASTFAQILVDKLGLPFEIIDLVQGDSDQLLIGGGTGGSRSTMAASKAILDVADEVIEKGRPLAAGRLEADAQDIDFSAGAFHVVGTDRSVGLLTLAAEHPGILDSALIADTPPSSFPNGCHVAEVEIDPETGVVTLLSYEAVDDFGTLVNPALVEGQVHGGVAQGIGQALLEHTVYDEAGQLLAGSYMDYALPRAADLTNMEFRSVPTPATTNPLGVKGCGEAGVTGALPAVMNAVVDALSPYGITHIDMPATPERVWSAIRQAERGH